MELVSHFLCKKAAVGLEKKDLGWVSGSTIRQETVLLPPWGKKGHCERDFSEQHLIFSPVLRDWVTNGSGYFVLSLKKGLQWLCADTGQFWVAVLLNRDFAKKGEEFITYYNIFWLWYASNLVESLYVSTGSLWNKRSGVACAEEFLLLASLEPWFFTRSTSQRPKVPLKGLLQIDDS